MKYLFLQITFLAFISLNAQKNQWEEEMNTFNKLDNGSPIQKGILFTGSSSIRFWKNLATDFKNPTILNRGFGGSQIIDLIENFDPLILKYHPTQIVVYSGDNDVEYGKSAEIVFGDFCTLLGMIKAKLPKTKVYFISIKPSLSRWDKVLEMKKANTMINEYANTKPNLYYIDVFSPMLCNKGKPCEKWFIEDGLHMTEKGYKLWVEILAPYLKK